MNSRKHGFTLIELLVVIAIIAILVSILMPSLAKAKELAKRTACSSNMHNMLLSCHTYANDTGNKERYPSIRMGANAGQQDAAASDLRTIAILPRVPGGLGLLVAQKYMPSSQLSMLYCPSLDNRNSDYPGLGMNMVHNWGVGADYWNDPAHANKRVIMGYTYTAGSYYQFDNDMALGDRRQVITTDFAGNALNPPVTWASSRILLMDFVLEHGYRRYGHRDGIMTASANGSAKFFRDQAGVLESYVQSQGGSVAWLWYEWALGGQPSPSWGYKSSMAGAEIDLYSLIEGAR